jgi:glyoxylase-like metal-dependent hydrolase (beta-lactamase superfamily II)
VPDHHLQPFSPHIHWLPPYGPTDRPVLGLVSGTRETLLVDAGNSAAHARLLTEGAMGAGLRLPSLVMLTHWHWDHVFGTGSWARPTFAHRETARRLAEMAGLAWDDAALDARVADGREIAFCRDMLRAELPAPREVVLRPASDLFDEGLDLDLGGVTALVRQVGGDHAADSSVVYIPEDRVVFLGDCFYPSIYGGPRSYTAEQLLPLLDRLLAFDADWYLVGHHPDPLPRAELAAWAARVPVLVAALDQAGGDLSAAQVAAAQALGEQLTDDDLEDLETLWQGRG